MTDPTPKTSSVALSSDEFRDSPRKFRWRKINPLLATALVVVGVWACPFAAAAQDDDAGTEGGSQTDANTEQQARELYLRGDRLYAEGRYDEAVEAFRGSFELSGRPELQFNLANAYERLGRLEEALASLREYAPHAPPYEQSTIQRRVENLQQRLDAGDVAQPNQPADPAIIPPVSRNGGLESRETEGPSLGGPLVLLGVGGAVAATAVVLAVLANSARQDAEDACQDVGSGFLCPESAQSDVNREQDLSIAADITGGLSAALLAGGLIWMLIELGADPESDRAVAFDLQLSPEQAGLQADFAF